MKLKELMARMPYYYLGKKSIYITSPPGRGKTETLCSASSILSKRFNKNMGHVVINGPLLNPQDAVGYLIPKYTDDGRAESHYTDPFWFKTQDGKNLSEFDGGIIIVDEADKMDTDVKKIIGEAALSGRLGPHTLAGGWVVWMAGNRIKDRSGSTKELDHLINRRMELEIEDDIEGFIEWGVDNQLLTTTLAFAQQYPQVVFMQTDPVKQGPWCTPRSLASSDHYLRIIMQETGEAAPPEDATTREEVAGMIGQGAAAQYFAVIKLDRAMPKFSSICEKPMDVKVPDKPDALMLVAYNLAHRVDEKTIDPVVKYMSRIPKEYAVTFVKTACQRNQALITTQAVRDWCQTNGSLVTMIAR